VSTRPRLLTWTAGGWVLLASGLLCGAVGVWRLTSLLEATRHAVRGDGVHVESYGFDLSTCLIPREQIRASGRAADSLPLLNNPNVLTAGDVATLTARLRRTHQGKFLVRNDRVVGVALNGEERAYPLRLLNYHEVVNDIVGGVPVVVVYSPSCDSVVVLDRTTDAGVLQFGDSGLVYNCGLLLYDRQVQAGTESLWCPLQFRAVSGPAAARGAELRLVPTVVVHWADWMARYPDTTVLAPDLACWKLYQQTSDRYLRPAGGALAVAPPPPADGPAPTAPVLALRTADSWHVWPIDVLAAAINERAGELLVDGMHIKWNARTRPTTVWPEATSGERLDVVYCRWFAWWAHHPEATLHTRLSE
jgi:hypothetical protein